MNVKQVSFTSPVTKPYYYDLCRVEKIFWNIKLSTVEIDYCTIRSYYNTFKSIRIFKVQIR